MNITQLQLGLLIGMVVSIHAVPLFLPPKARQEKNGVVTMDVSQSGEEGQLEEEEEMVQEKEGVIDGPEYLAMKPTDPDLRNCPAICQCTLKNNFLNISHCIHDPGTSLYQLLLDNTNVTKLIIANSKLKLTPRTIQNLTKLESLDLSSNLLEDPSWDILKKLPHLNSLSLNHNLIKVLRKGSLYKFPCLQYLSMEFNGLQEIELDVFYRLQDLPPLNSLHFANNNLTTIDVSFLQLFRPHQHIEIALNLNHISNFTNGMGWKLRCDVNTTWDGILNLGDNRITHFSDLMNKMGIEEVELICLFARRLFKPDFRGNPFVCDCIDFRFYAAFRMVHTSVYVTELFCRKPDKLYKTKLISVPPDKLVCQVHEKCPSDCVCTNIPAKMAISVNCSNQEMITVPEELPNLPKINYHYHLYFNHNNLSTIHDQWYFNHTSVIDLGSNHVDNISLTLFNTANIVNLTRNELTRMPYGISKFQLDGQKFYLEGNPWNCDCHFHETRNWILESKAMIPDNAGLLCDSPTRFRGTNILKISQNDMICGAPPNIELFINMGIAGGTLVCSLLILVVPISVLFKKRVWLYRKLKWHPFELDECEGEDKEYDVFVSYDNKDEEYVEDYLLPGLQDRDYRVCYHRVHFPPGQSIVSSIEHCICRSKRTLFVFSNNFKESEWCKWELAVALELNQNTGTHRTIAILYDDVEVKNLDLTARAFFKKYTYVERDSEYFWDNLQYGLAQRKMGPENRNYPIGPIEDEDQRGINEERVGLLNAEDVHQ